MPDVSCAVRSGSWNIGDLPGFRVVLFMRAQDNHAAGAPNVSPTSTRTERGLREFWPLGPPEESVFRHRILWLAYSPKSPRISPAVADEVAGRTTGWRGCALAGRDSHPLDD